MKWSPVQTQMKGAAALVGVAILAVLAGCESIQGCCAQLEVWKRRLSQSVAPFLIFTGDKGSGSQRLVKKQMEKRN
jgi:hypothetical protein